MTTANAALGINFNKTPLPSITTTSTDPHDDIRHTMSGKHPVAFIGLGAMGYGMAVNLVKEGFQVTGFDVYGPTLERFSKDGGLVAKTPADAVSGKQYCVCMVATAQQAQSVLLDGENAALTALPSGAVIFLCSTVPCSYVQGLEKELEARGRGDILLIDCPVSGGAIRAANGTLSIMAGASAAALEKGRHILQVMSDSQKLYIGGEIGAGSNIKMCHQVLAANQILSASEAMGFARHLDLDLQSTGAYLIKSEGWSWMLENRMPRILDANHGPLASAVTIILKDTSIITQEARRVGFPTPMTSAAEQVYFASLGKGFGPEDDAGLIRMYTEGKGRVGPVKGLAESDDAKLTLVVNLLRGIHLCSAVETLVFSHFLGLDLDQIFELCINAAGGSAILSAVGPQIIKILRGQSLDKHSVPQLRAFATELTAAVNEAQRLKVPVSLGAAALNLINLALQGNASEASGELLVKLWTK